MANVPDLSVKGWITTPLEKADKMMAHFYAAEKSQSNLFPNDVHSFTFILQKNLNEPTSLKYDLEENLVKYFNKYFRNTLVAISVTDDPRSASKQNVEISIQFETEDGRKWDLANIATVKNSLFEKYTTYNNTGTITSSSEDLHE